MMSICCRLNGRGLCCSQLFLITVWIGSVESTVFYKLCNLCYPVQMQCMKTIYFIRHGETDGNKFWRHQHNDTPLATSGREQATRVAQLFKDRQVDVIVASPLARTRETAQIVQQQLPSVRIEFDERLTELRRPSELWGTSWFSLRSLWIMGLSYLRAGVSGWHYSDEENLDEFHVRSKQVLEMLTRRPEEHILVVTHRGLMAVLEERMKRDGMDTVSQYRRALWKNLRIKNCCFLTTQWTPEGENGDTLTGTWSVEEGITCPST